MLFCNRKLRQQHKAHTKHQTQRNIKTRRQLRKLIREAEGTTKKYDDDSALRGDQDELPDVLQKGIIDKAVEDREEREEEEKNESFSITRRQLRGIIAELGIDRMTSGDNDPRLDDPDDLTVGLEVAEEMVGHLQAINDLVTSERGRRSLPDYMDSKKYVTVERFQKLDLSFLLEY